MFSRVVGWAVDPYDGVAESEITSNKIAVWDGIAWSYTVTRTSGVTASIVTCRVSNSPLRDAGAVPDATFVSHSTVAGDGDDLGLGDAGTRFVQFQRAIVSGVSQSVLLSKLQG